MTSFDASQLATSPIFANMVAVRSALLVAVVEYTDVVPSPDVTLKFKNIEERDMFIDAFLALRGVKKDEAK